MGRTRVRLDGWAGTLRACRAAACALVTASAALLAVAGWSVALAQVPPQVEGRQPEDVQQPLPEPPAALDLPTVTTPSLGAPPGAEGATFVLRGIVIEGATVYPPETFTPLYGNLIGTTVALSQVFQVAQAVEDRYRGDGYVLSRVVVPAQTVSDGVFRLQVIEGYVSAAVIQGDVGDVRTLIQAYLDNVTRIRPVRIQDLERYLLLTNDLPGITARAVLRPAAGQAGAAQMIVDVRRDALEGFVRVDNRGSEFAGPLEAAARFSANSYTRFGDKSSVVLFSALDSDESRYGALQFEGRVGSEGLSFTATASYAPAEPGESLSPLDIDSEALRFGIGARYPVIRTRRTSLYVDGGFDFANIDIDVLDTPDTRDRLRVLYGNVEVTHRDGMDGVSQLRVGFRQGLDLFDATDDDDDNRSRDDADGTFTTLSFEASRLQRLTGDLALYVAAAGQYAFEPVLADEEFTLGGASFGRGYEPAELTGDNGLAATAELQYSPNFGHDLLQDYQLYAFYDYGVVWQKDTPGDDSDDLSSAGIGVRGSVNNWLSFELEMAKPLTRRPVNEDTRAVRLYFSAAARF